MRRKWELNRIQTKQTESQGKGAASGEPQQVDISETPETPDGEPLSRKSGDGARRRFTDYRESKLRSYQSTPHRINSTLYARDESDSSSNSSPVSLPEQAYNRMWLHHSGWYSDDTGRREAMDKIALTQALVDELPITNYEERRALDIIPDLKNLQFNRIGGTVAAILGTLAYVREESIAQNRLPTTDPDKLMELRIVDSEPYQELCSQFNVCHHEALKKVKRSVD